MAKHRGKKHRIHVTVTLEGEVATRNANRTYYTLRVNPDMTVGHVIARIRDKLTIRAEEGIFVFHGGIVPPMSATVLSLACNGKLALTIVTENAFGSA